jgi:glycosyltransferase involved in cell wall biosynthesis
MRWIPERDGGLMREKLLHLLGRIRQAARHQRLSVHARLSPLRVSTCCLAHDAPVVAINMYPAAGAWGGSSVFVHQFMAALRRCGIRPVFDLNGRVDVILLVDPREDLLNKAFGMEEIRSYRDRHPEVRVIHRINECDQRKASDFMDECLRQANDLADHTVFISEWLQEYFVSRWFDVGRSHQVIYNGADPAVFHPLGADRFDGGTLRLVTHHFSSHLLKGFAVYQQVDEMIADGRLPDTELWIIGGRPPEMHWHASRLFAPVAGRELATLLRQCHAYITASLWEPCGMHHVEGAQCGLPLLYHEDGGGIVEAGRRYGIGFREETLRVVLKDMRHRYPEMRKRVFTSMPDGLSMAMDYVRAVYRVLSLAEEKRNR